MEPVRVLYLDHVVHLSGAEQSLFDLVVGLGGGPVEPVVVLPDDGPLSTQLRAAGVLVRKVKMSKRLLETSRTALRTRPFVALLRAFSFVAAVVRLRRIIREMRPQVIHSNTMKMHLISVIPAKLAGVPLVWHVRDILPRGLLRRAFNVLARFPDRIIVPSRAVAASMGRSKLVYRKLRLIPNGIRVDTFDDRDEGVALRREIGAGSKDVVVGIVGRIAPWKGQDVFVHAAAMVADRYPKARFAIVGSALAEFGDEFFQQELASLVYDYELDGNVFFTGWRTAQEAMAALDVVVHASVEPEPFGRTIVEAMAAGRPVVAAAGGATGELLPPNAGFIVPPARPEILADALENLLADRKLREEMGANGKAVAHRFFDVRRTVGAVGALYAEIAREGAKAAAARRKRGGVFAVLQVVKRRRRPSVLQRSRTAARYPGTRRMQPMPRTRRPAAAAVERRPPVLRPDTPDSMPAGKPQRRRPASEDAALRPVRRTARIEIDIDDEEAPSDGGFELPPEPPRRRDQKRSVPAMSERRPRRGPIATPERRVHRNVEFEGGHVIRRPAVLDDPTLDEPAGVDLPSEPVRPVRRSVPVRTSIPVTTQATAPVLEPDSRPSPAVLPKQKPQPVATPQPVVSPMPQHVADKPLYELAKRVMDIVVAAVVLVLGAPVWLGTALAIKLDSRGPVLFKGTVWGKDCRPFRYYKFRSMRIDGADDGHKEFIQQYVRTDGGVSHAGKTVFKYVGDSRITRVGRLIRKLSIDEIPQLVNVVRGQMSLVGPRPPLEYEYALYDDWARQRLSVRPGLTGLQQTYARHSAAFTEKVEMDLAYIRDRSMWLDLTIIAKTVPAAFKGE